MTRDGNPTNAPEMDWSDATVDGPARRVKVVHSARIPADLSEKLEAEATRRGLTPSALICEFVAAGLNDRNDDQLVTVRLSQLHEVLDRVIQSVSPRVAA